MTAPGHMRKVLVIKHGALGDVVLAQGPFQAIRRAHQQARIVLLTTAPYKSFLEKSGLFDEIWIDSRPKLWQPAALWRLRRRLRRARFDRVYDLQTSSRTGLYFKLLYGRHRPEWSGIAPGCSHPHSNPARRRMHTVERQAEQLQLAGVTPVGEVDFTWAAGDVARFALPEKFALLVPGGSAHRPEKRWPAGAYGVLARDIAAHGVTPVLIGGAAEAPAIAVIQAACPEAVSLATRTTLEDLAALGTKAAVAVGNDTGPLHLIAAVGCPVTVLFSHASDPARARPRGPAVTVLRQESLEALAPEVVLAGIKPYLGGT